jgi:hypothetical protein
MVCFSFSFPEKQKLLTVRVRSAIPYAYLSDIKSAGFSTLALARLPDVIGPVPQSLLISYSVVCIRLVFASLINMIISAKLHKIKFAVNKA